MSDAMGVAREDIPDVVQDYFGLIKTVYPGAKPAQVKLDEEDCDLVFIDGVAYDFSDIPHDDQINTGRRMEIEELLCGGYGELPISEVQVQLNEKIQKEW